MSHHNLYLTTGAMRGSAASSEHPLAEGTPTRHPDQPRPLPGAVRGVALAFGVRGPNTAEWESLGAGLTCGDGPMDELLSWMRSAGTARSKRLFDQAARDGIDAIPDAPEPLRSFFALVETPPVWVNWERVRRGQGVLRSEGADGIYLARDVSLLGGYQFSGFNKTLLRTGALEKGSNQRFAETFQWALDTIQEGGLDGRGVGYQSTLRVRLIHAFVRNHVSAMADWREGDWGLPVNQTDMAATVLGTFIAPTAAGFGMGLILSKRDLDDVAHFTRYVGWLLGVREESLPLSFRDGVRKLSHALAALAAPDETSQLLAKPMADDPLSWHFDRFPAMRRRLARAQHLSIAGTYLGPRTMRALGLPATTVPWYPLVRFPINATRSVTALLLPRGRDRAAARGWRQQQDLMRSITAQSAVIGDAATHIEQTA